MQEGRQEFSNIRENIEATVSTNIGGKMEEVMLVQCEVCQCPKSLVKEAVMFLQEYSSLSASISQYQI